MSQPEERTLPRRQTVRLGNGVEFNTPLLVPSLSSRAQDPISVQDERTREYSALACSTYHSRIFAGQISEALLVSAYDICNGYLHDFGTLIEGFSQSLYAQTKLLFIDNGWYEQHRGPFTGPLADRMKPVAPWTQTEFEAVIDDLDRDIHPIVSGWDQYGAYAIQIEQAQEFFGRRPHLASTIVLKPLEESGFHDFDNLASSTVRDLSVFGIVGVAEKDLGDSVLHRLVALARLRRMLDAASVTAPIHVLGGLDPLITPLLFAAGGEIFDGLGWLRYAYRNGISMHRDAGIVLDVQATTDMKRAQLYVQTSNLNAIQELARNLRVFEDTGSWEAFGKLVQETLEEKHQEFVAEMSHGRR